MQKMNLAEAETLLYVPLEKPSFVVDGLIPRGLSLFYGSWKIGKSWLSLRLCLCFRDCSWELMERKEQEEANESKQKQTRKPNRLSVSVTASAIT